MKIQLCYASSRQGQADDLIDDLSNILTIARDFNAKNNVFGVLYYANNSFFQCLEGEDFVVLPLFDHIKRDIRHTSIIEFDVKQIHKYSFKSWSMKYVQKSSKVDIYFSRLGHEEFLPSALTDQNLEGLLEALLNETQTHVRKKVGLNQRGIHPYF
ncbi:BLUF domain-containing protein [Acinetobacter sp. TUM15131]|uniref:BLUF domain-containing protein n=1 Tax=Acinetobacter sp. TUM15131 TaxID=2609141 RepID=UPI00124CF15B|nr:BLUF domain-containing protein [Acinetobacter sp. TUM15131]